MKLSLNCRTHEGKPVTWLYDHVTNEIWDDTGELVDLAHDDRLKIFEKMGGLEADLLDRQAKKDGGSSDPAWASVQHALQVLCSKH